MTERASWQAILTVGALFVGLVLFGVIIGLSVHP